MPKKVSVKKPLKEMYEKNKEKIIDILVSFLESGATNVLNWVKGVSKIKEKIRKLISIMVLTLAGVVVLFIGLAELLNYYFPALQNGLAYIIVGVVMILVAWLYGKAR